MGTGVSPALSLPEKFFLLLSGFFRTRLLLLVAGEALVTSTAIGRQAADLQDFIIKDRFGAVRIGVLTALRSLTPK